MQNRELFNQYALLKEKMCDYITSLIDDRCVELNFIFQDVSVSSEDEERCDGVYEVSKLHLEDDHLYILITNTTYPHDTEWSPLERNSMDVIFRVCELVEKEFEVSAKNEDNELPFETIIRCTKCQSTKVQVKKWVYPNQNDEVAFCFLGDLLDETNDC